MTSKDVRGAGVGCVSGKQRPGNGGDDDRGGIVPAAGKCGGDPDGAALPLRAIDSSGGAARRGSCRQARCGAEARRPRVSVKSP